MRQEKRFNSLKPGDTVLVVTTHRPRDIGRSQQLTQEKETVTRVGRDYFYTRWGRDMEKRWSIYTGESSDNSGYSWPRTKAFFNELDYAAEKRRLAQRVKLATRLGTLTTSNFLSKLSEAQVDGLLAATDDLGLDNE